MLRPGCLATWTRNALLSNLICVTVLSPSLQTVFDYIGILHPGAKNPLPLSGLWKSDSVRFPLRWKRRMDSEGTAKHGVPHILAKSASKGPKGAYAPAIDTQDDLASFRISVHSKEAEALLAQAKMGPTIPVNRTHVPQENVLYVAQELSEYVE